MSSVVEAPEHNAPSSTIDVEVLVVGAGPVGLTAAALLSACGVDVLVVERNASTSEEPKAISIDDESLRTFAAAGLIDAVLPIVTPGTGTRYYGADGVPLFQARAAIPFRLGYPFKNPFAQPDLERALNSAAAADPRVQVRFGTALTGLSQDEHGVTGTVRDLARDTFVGSMQVSAGLRRRPLSGPRFSWCDDERAQSFRGVVGGGHAARSAHRALWHAPRRSRAPLRDHSRPRGPLPV